MKKILTAAAMTIAIAATTLLSSCSGGDTPILKDFNSHIKTADEIVERINNMGEATLENTDGVFITAEPLSETAEQ